MLPGDTASLRKARGAFFTPAPVARFGGSDVLGVNPQKDGLNYVVLTTTVGRIDPDKARRLADLARDPAPVLAASAAAVQARELFGADEFTRAVLGVYARAGVPTTGKQP